MRRAGISPAWAALSVAAAAGLVLARRSSPGLPPVPPLPFKPPPVPPPDGFRLPSVVWPLASEWQRARLTEYHPDTPASAGKKAVRREGGKLDRQKQPLITLEQHRADPLRYPYVSVSADLVLQGRVVPYGARIFIEALPRDVLRIVDTGGHFFTDAAKNAEKVIREPGHEPLDIATAWPGTTQKLSGTLTRYRVDWLDVLPRPRIS